MRDSFPIDPDSIIEPEEKTEAPHPHHDGEYIERLCCNKKPTFQMKCPHAQADKQNEKFAVFIRSCFCGKRSELTLMTAYLYQSVKFGCCSEELCSTLYTLSVRKHKHLKMLGDLLCSLGGDPKYFCGISPNAIAGSWWNTSPTVIKYPCDIGEAIKYLLAMEKESAEEYNNIKAYVDDCGIKSALTEIIDEKKQDIEILTLLYTRFCS